MPCRAAFLPPEDKTGHREYHNGKPEHADEEAIRQTEDVAHVQSIEPVGHRIAAVLSGREQQELHLAGVGVKAELREASPILDVAAAAHAKGT
jgi:hypothetical protein